MDSAFMDSTVKKNQTDHLLRRLAFAFIQHHQSRELTYMQDESGERESIPVGD